jgi:hypothetical protein
MKEGLHQTIGLLQAFFHRFKRKSSPSYEFSCQYLLPTIFSRTSFCIWPRYGRRLYQAPSTSRDLPTPS